MNSSGMAYIAKCPTCDNIVVAAADEPHVMQHASKDLAKAMRDGLVVERVTNETVRSTPWGCKCPKVKKTRKAA